MSNAFTIPATSSFLEGKSKREFMARPVSKKPMTPMVLPNSSKYGPPGDLTPKKNAPVVKKR